LKDIQQLPAILQHSKTIFTLYIQALLTFSGTTRLNFPVPGFWKELRLAPNCGFN
jgi:hypothetical protein